MEQIQADALREQLERNQRTSEWVQQNMDQQINTNNGRLKNNDWNLFATQAQTMGPLNAWQTSFWTATWLLIWPKRPPILLLVSSRWDFSIQSTFLFCPRRTTRTRCKQCRQYKWSRCRVNNRRNSNKWDNSSNKDNKLWCKTLSNKMFNKWCLRPLM